MQLLVSVRSIEEAGRVVDLVDVLDVKEPQRGSLGAAAPEVLHAIVRKHGSRLPISAALGELLQLETDWASDLPSLSYAKFGLSGCDDVEDWKEIWSDACRKLPAVTRPVAVFYADRQHARVPSCEQIVDHAAHLGCPILLIDTFQKSDGRLFDWLTLDQLKLIQEVVQARGMQLAIAGSLALKDWSMLRELNPSIVAVRSAVCDESRVTPVSRTKTEHFAARLKAAPVD